ncbi:MAG: cytochrome c biogenesis protein CcdA [Bacteroidota bacterium]
MRILLQLLIVLFGFASQLNAQIYNPVKWDMDYKQINDQEFNLVFTATIEDGWSIYSQYLESDDGPVRTSFEFDSGAHFELVGKNEESGNRKEAFDNLFDMNVIKFSKKAIFTQKVKVKDLSKPISGYLEFMTCDATKCLPPDQVDFEFKLKSSGKTGAIDTPAKTATEKIAENTATASNTAEQVVEETVAKIEEKVANTTGIDGATDTKLADATKSSDDKVTDAPSATPTDDKDVMEAPSYNAEAGQGGGLLDPVKWTFSVKKIKENTYDLIYVASIDPGWHIYSQFLGDEDGPVPTTFAFREDPNFTLTGKAIEDSPKRIQEFDKFFDMKLVKFKESASFTQRIHVTDLSQPVMGDLSFMSCEAGRCLPPAYIDFWFEPSTMVTLLGEEASEKIGYGSADNGMATTLGGGSDARWKLDGNVVDQEIASIKSSYQNPVGDCGDEENANGQSLIVTFILGFLGGLVALLTPCVFPMIPLTVSYFTKGSKDRVTGIRNGLIYGASIIVIYVSIGLLLTAVFGPGVLNWLSTHWVPNTLFFIIFIVFAFSFFGFYEITLPSSWANRSDTMADKGGLVGIFFMAFTLAIVSFSCTGPIIGTALVQAASSANAIGPATVMFGFSLALALPFGLFAAFPAWLNSLPSSGSWMNSVKVVLGFLELALAFKFLSVADMTMNWDFLKYELFMGIWVLLAIGMTLYLFGIIKFPHDSPLQKLSAPRWGFALLSLATTIYLASGFMYNEKTKTYNSLALMSGLAPPAQYNFFLEPTQPDPVIKAKYKSFSKCANNLDCFKDYYEGLAYSRETKKPILLDFTGHGCVNCRKTEEHIWVRDEVWKKLKDDFVLISLYVDDRKKLDGTFVSKYTNKKIRNIGGKWTDFQVVNFNQNSQPLYVMMTPDEKVLAKPRGYKDDVDGYAEFLECGLNTYSGIEKQTGMK